MAMPLTETLELLRKARRFVTDGEGFLSKQKVYVEKLERQGRDTFDAIFYLETLEDMQEVYVEHMEKLERQVLLLVKPGDD